MPAADDAAAAPTLGMHRTAADAAAVPPLRAHRAPAADDAAAAPTLGAHRAPAADDADDVADDAAAAPPLGALHAPADAAAALPLRAHRARAADDDAEAADDDDADNADATDAAQSSDEDADEASEAEVAPKRARRIPQLTEVPYTYNHVIGESNAPVDGDDLLILNDIMRRAMTDLHGMKVCDRAAHPPRAPTAHHLRVHTARVRYAPIARAPSRTRARSLRAHCRSL